MQYQIVGFLPRLRDSFWRHRWLFLISVIIVSAISGGALALRHPAYYASASTQVFSNNEEMASAIGEQAPQSWVSVAQQQVNHFNDLLSDNRPDGFLDTALKNAQLTHPINIDPRARDPRAMKMLKGLNLSADSGTLFTVGLTWDDATECEQIVKALQDQYIEVVGTDRQASSVAVTKFLENEIASYARRMGNAEQALINYKQKNAGQLPEQQQGDLQQVATLRTQRDNLTIISQDSDKRRQAIEARMKQITPMSVLKQTIVDGPNQLALRQISAQRTALLQQGMQPTSDKVLQLTDIEKNLRAAADKEIAAAKAKFGNAAPGSDVTSTELQNNPEYQQLNQQLTNAIISQQSQAAQMNMINNKISEYEARIQKIPLAQRDLTEKTRDYTILKAHYEDLLNRREQAQLKANLDKITARSTMVPVGTVYAQSTTPRSKQMLLFVGSLILGFVVGIAVVLLSEWNDTTLRYGADAERLLHLPLLGEVPELRALSPAALTNTGTPTPSTPENTAEKK